MNTWWTSDQHYNHANILKYAGRIRFMSVAERKMYKIYCKLSQAEQRKFIISQESLERMNKGMITEHNSRVKPGDTVFSLGDFIFKNSPGGKKGEGLPIKAVEIENQLNGKLVFIKGNHDCFSMDTRLLTKKGYKTYNEVKKGDLIPTVNLMKKTIEYKPIKEIILTAVTKAYQVKSRGVSGLFSENHRHLYSFGTSSNLPIKINTSKNLWEYKSPLRLISAYKSGNKKYNISNNWLKLLAWIMTDGGINKRGYICLYQSKKDNVILLKKLLKNLKLNYGIGKRQRNITHICGKKLKTRPKISYVFRITAKSSRGVLDKLSLKNKYNLPEWVFKLSDKQCDIFVKELIKGDGTIQNTGTFVLWGKKIFLEQIMGLCVTHNLKSNLIKDCRDSYYLTISRRKHNREKHCIYKEIFAKQRTIKSCKSNMWCINVENNVIFIERNGKTLITGNSSNSLKTPIESIVIRYGGKRINMVHKPVHVNPNFKINFVGHVHANWQIKRIKTQFGYTDAINVGVDCWGYRPVSFNEIMKRYHQWKKKARNK